MTLTRHLAGFAWLAAVFVPLVYGAVAVRRALFQGWDLARARLVEALIVVASAILVAQLLGTVRLFSPLPIAVACVFVGFAVGFVARKRGRGVASRDAGRPTDSGTSSRAVPVLPLVGLAVVAFVVARWMIGVFAAYDNGPVDVDSQTYHLPHAARFVQEGSLTGIHFATVDDAVPYHPENGEIFHALGMLAFSTEVLSPLINIGWLGLTLLAAWTIGDRWQRGWLALIAAAVPLATPIMSTTQGGSAMTDIAAIALLVTAVAFLVHADGRGPPIVAAGLAAGLALGTKLTVVVPVAVLTVASFIVARPERYSRSMFAILWTVPLLIGGSFWYVRNLVAAGNPLPSVDLTIGSIGFQKIPMMLVDRYGYAVSDYLFDGPVWERYFLPGLAWGFGRGWALLLLACGVAALVAILRGRSAFVRAAAASAAISAVAYIFTPTTAVGTRGMPTLFAGNLRYVVPSLVVALLLGVCCTELTSRWARLALALALLIPLVLIAATGWHGRGREAVISGVLGVGMAVAVRAIAAMPPLIAGAASAAALVIVAVASSVAHDVYLDSRYAYAEGRAVGRRDQTAYAWAQSVRNAKIGMAGFFVNYPLYGRDLSNEVSYVGDHRPDGSFTNHRSCESWRRAVNEGDYDYIVTMPPFAGHPQPAATEWTKDDASVSIAASGDEATVFEIEGRLDPGGC